MLALTNEFRRVSKLNQVKKENQIRTVKNLARSENLLKSQVALVTQKRRKDVVMKRSNIISVEKVQMLFDRTLMRLEQT